MGLEMFYPILGLMAVVLVIIALFKVRYRMCEKCQKRRWHWRTSYYNFDEDLNVGYCNIFVECSTCGHNHKIWDGGRKESMY